MGIARFGVVLESHEVLDEQDATASVGGDNVPPSTLMTSFRRLGTESFSVSVLARS